MRARVFARAPNADFGETADCVRRHFAVLERARIFDYDQGWRKEVRVLLLRPRPN